VDILVVNSDPEVEKQLRALLERRGHHVRVAPGIPEALALIGPQPADLLVVACQELETSGAALFRLLDHSPHPPVILPTASQPDGDHDQAELSPELQHVQDALLQVQRLLADPQGELLRVGDLAIDMDRKRVLFRGQLIPLPPIQFRLLAYLARNAGRVVDARELLKAVWEYEEDETEARELVKVHVRQIRRRLGLGAQTSDYVQSVRGFGYVVNAPSES
jgi:two-component system KDP operon response regulator KdpE